LLEETFLLTVQKEPKPLDIFAVILFGDLEVTGSSALIDAVKEAGPIPLPLRVLGFDVQRAVAELENPLQDLDRSAERLGVGKWTIQLDTPVCWLTGKLDAGEVFMRGDLQVGEGLIVFEVDIELWL